MKDATLSKAVKIAINHKLKEYGKMIKFNLDSDNKTIDLELMLDKVIKFYKEKKLYRSIFFIEYQII